MTIEYLKRFVTLSEYLNFSKAANVLAISQPTLSYSISSLEEIVGAALLERTSTSVKLTWAGERFLPVAVQTIQLLEQTMDEIRREARLQQS